MTIEFGSTVDRLVAQPIALPWLLLLVTMLALFWRGQWRPFALVTIAAGAIWVVGCTPIPIQLLAELERPYARGNWQNLPTADAVVMLGGTHEAHTNDVFGFDLAPTGDRILVAIELMRLGRARTLVLSGSGYDRDGQRKPEAEVLVPWLRRWNLVTNEVVVVGPCTSTHDEAVQLQALAAQRKWKHILLVTSASHLRRAEKTVGATGLKVTPVGADFIGLSRASRGLKLHLLPGINGFYEMALYLHEIVGWYYYQGRGWIPSTSEPTPETKPAAQAQPHETTNPGWVARPPVEARSRRT